MALNFKKPHIHVNGLSRLGVNDVKLFSVSKDEVSDRAKQCQVPDPSALIIMEVFVLSMAY